MPTSVLHHIPIFIRRLTSLEPSGGASGQASDIAIHAKEILRVREQLTKIYQRHCAKDGEIVEDGLARFGTFPCLPYMLPLKLVITSNAFLERALERDYFLTGMSISCAFNHLLTIWYLIRL